MDIVEKVIIDSSADAVYTAITSQNGIESWWAKRTSVATHVGEVSTMHFDKEGVFFEMQFRVDELIPNRRVLWTCIKNSNPAWERSNISFDLKDVNDQTELEFRHYNFEPQWENSPWLETVPKTWEMFITQSLKNYCEKGEGQPWG
jgi:uncharacterized protein YndB with AHSA1/START domain